MTTKEKGELIVDERTSTDIDALTLSGGFNLYKCIKSRINLFQIVTYDSNSIRSLVLDVASALGMDWWKWNIITGPMKYDVESNMYQPVDPNQGTEEGKGLQDFMTFMTWYNQLEHEEANNSIVIMEDVDLAAFANNTENAMGVALIKNFHENVVLKGNRVIIFQQHAKRIPAPLNKIMYYHEMDLPSKNDLEILLEGSCEFLDRSGDYPPILTERDGKWYDEFEKEYSSKEVEINHANRRIVDMLIDSAKGLSLDEASDAFSKIVLENKINNTSWVESNIDMILHEKENIIKKSGYLEFYNTQDSLDNIGGMDVLIDWIRKRGKAFTPEAKEFGLPLPRGVLLLGIPGTGKSLTAKSIGNAWKYPTIRLDMGKIFAGLVGESEGNMRNVLKIVEAIAPCVLWIDEIEKGMSGLKSSGSTDGGTTSRVLGTFLTWMQEKDSSVFVVATANDISNLPPELLRKGRVDEIFFVDLPNQKEREDILKIHIKKYGRNPNNFNISELADATKLFSGAELEEVIKDSLYTAFSEGKELEQQHILESAKKTYPMAKTMNTVIDKMKKWADKRAVRASSLVNDEKIRTDEQNTFDNAKGNLSNELKDQAADPLLKKKTKKYL